MWCVSCYLFIYFWQCISTLLESIKYGITLPFRLSVASEKNALFILILLVNLDDACSLVSFIFSTSFMGEANSIY